MTGLYWNLKNPKKPYGELDVHAKLDVPMSWRKFCDDSGVTIASHTLTPEAPLKVVQSGTTGEGAIVLFRVAVDQTLYLPTHLTSNSKFGVTCHVVFSDGQEDDQTLYFKLVEK